MTFWTYMLRCRDGSYYIGHTDHLDHRVGQHQAGEIPGYTATRRPVEVVWSAEFSTRVEALEAERQIKGWSRAKKEALIRGDWPAIRRLASRAKILRDETEPSPSSVSASPQDKRTLTNPVRPEERLSPGEGASRRTTTPPPVIVLVRPQLGENIGKAARAMLNFGLTELRLVAPRDGWPNPDAGPAAAGADIVLAEAQVFASLADAVADCTTIYATTVRKRGVMKPVLTPEAAARAVHADAGRSAYIFGAERSGLETDDVALAHAIVTVPINPAFASLNLAQAVILLAYEWSKHVPTGAEGSVALASPPTVTLNPVAPHGELEELIQHLVRDLDASGYFNPPERTEATLRTLRTALTKTGWSHNDIRMMHGIITSLGRKPRAR